MLPSNNCQSATKTQQCAAQNLENRRQQQQRQQEISALAQTVSTTNNRRTPAFPSTRTIEAKTNFSRMTVWRVLRKAGFRPFVRRAVPVLDPRVHEKRLLFARDWLRHPARDFSALVFSDEHWISTNDHTCRQMWCRRRAEVSTREQKSPFNVPGILVWAAIGVNWRSKLVFLVDRHKTSKSQDGKSNRVDANKYVRCCLSTVCQHLVDARSIFQQDGARIHTASRTAAYLARKNVNVMDSWPPFSPDLNPNRTVVA